MNLNPCFQVWQVSDASNATSSKIDTGQWLSASFQASFGADGAAAGTLKVQASNDPCPYGNQAKNFTPTNWTDVSGATATVTAGGSVLIPLTTVNYRWLRLVWTPTGGAGTLTVNANAVAY